MDICIFTLFKNYLKTSILENLSYYWKGNAMTFTYRKLKVISITSKKSKSFRFENYLHFDTTHVLFMKYYYVLCRIQDKSSTQNAIKYLLFIP